MATIVKSQLAHLGDTIIDNGHWQFPQQLDYLKAAGFIYLIKEKATGRKYIGRKNFRSYAKLTKGKQSNWKVYTSSSKDLNELIVANGKQAFEFHVLEQYYSIGGVGWAETWSQCVAETASNHDVFLNKLIDKVTWKSTEHISARHKERLQVLVK